ncbi:amino acid adenylation domain-containing protein [Duganella sp. LX20W]|uniref:Amino acid adenylation domain-containing protein n=1 Tax=Rugamonas brunnea TaxID=2758569 RepID=A0A7W2IA52_9BURK|nr:non-ribosomal peptide synthetase [Rugamonas brunnea]MBA5635775.1 amino acid adenylation domain-containing protein [Rugamonas brunnea]
MTSSTSTCPHVDTALPHDGWLPRAAFPPLAADAADAATEAWPPLSGASQQRLRELESRHHLAPGHGLLAAWLALLHQLTDQAELAVFELRPGGWSGIASAVEASTTYTGLLRSLGRKLGTARPQQLEARDDQAGPQCRLGFCLDDGTLAPPSVCPDQLDLLLILPAGGQGAVRWRARLADACTRRHLQLLLVLLDKLLARPDEVLGRLDPLCPAERARLLHAFQDTATAYPRDSTLVDLLRDSAARDADRLAVTDGRRTLTRGQLLQQASALAARLQRHGVTPAAPVALLMPRDCAMVVATVASLVAGACYCPLDPDYPPERIAYCLADSGARCLLVSDAATLAMAQALQAAGQFSGAVLVVDPAGQDDDADRAVPVAAPVRASDTAYLMYTSGTTGQPKGVLVSHRGVVRLVRDTNYIRFDEDSRVLQAGAIGFDASTFELWGALLNGGELHIVGRDTLLSARLLGQFLAASRINTALITSSLFAQLANENAALFQPLRTLVIGGDVVPARQVQAVRLACPGLTVVNAYGPTENAVISTAHVIGDADGLDIPIGRPISNSSAYVLGRLGQLQPVGVPGELYVGGDGIGNGYLERPELTQAAFVPSPFGPGATLYRTGDMARWRDDGTLDFLGRRDQQIKVRGFRVELGEVENQLLAIADVTAAIVIARRSAATGESQLHAWFTARTPLDPARVRAQLADALPVHMVPHLLRQLDALPLTANGKIDRQALQAAQVLRPVPAAAETAAPAQVTPLEQTVLQLLSALLEGDAVTLDDNALALGASSLTAAMLAARIETQLHKPCTAAMVLASATLRALCHALVQSPDLAPDARQAIPALTRRATYRAAPQQQQLYVAWLKDPASRAYHLPIEIAWDGQADLARLEAALNELVCRHDILRTSFHHDGAALQQQVQAMLAVRIEQREAGDDMAAAIDAWARPFDLEQAPAWRVALFRSRGHGRDQACLLLDLHHILADAISIALLLEQWQALYLGQPVPLPSHQFGDYAEWRHAPATQQWHDNLAPFWRATMNGWQRAPELPLDRTRAALRSERGAMLAVDLGEQRSAALRRCAQTLRLTPFHLLLASYALWLAGTLDQTEVTVGSPAAGRQAAGTESLVGMLVNTVCLRIDVAGNDTAADWLRRTARHIDASFEHQAYPFASLADAVDAARDYRRHPVFDTMFALQNTALGRQAFLGQPVRWAPEHTASTLFDLNLQLDDSAPVLRGHWAYNRDLFDAVTVQTFRDDWLAMLDRLLAQPDAPLASLLAAPATPAPAPVLAPISFTL